jgi:hypothetical protein
MNIREQDIELALSGEIDVWTFGNEVLYRLCRDYPKHDDPGIIVAKVWLIGRAYAAAIERRKHADPDNPIANDPFYEKVVAPALKDSDLDNRLDSLHQYREINNENVAVVLETHKYLLDEFKKLTGLYKRSLASKYLHFHHPNLFFIYDSRATSSLREIMPRQKVRQLQQECDCDSEYAVFTLKLLELCGEIERRFHYRLTPRQIDRLLLNRAIKDERLATASNQVLIQS